MIKKSPPPLFAKEGGSSLWKREVRSDFHELDVHTIMRPLIFSTPPLRPSTGRHLMKKETFLSASCC
jgi:hypothetical protein